jgi:OOP family OmpA-OmpF porin
MSTESDVAGVGDVSAWVYHLDALYHFMPENALVPFVFAPGRHIPLTGQRGVDSNMLFNWGGGLKYF